jgi:hypothetical protein
MCLLLSALYSMLYYLLRSTLSGDSKLLRFGGEISLRKPKANRQWDFKTEPDDSFQVKSHILHSVDPPVAEPKF